jgi:hypothetical protein
MPPLPLAANIADTGYKPAGADELIDPTLNHVRKARALEIAGTKHRPSDRQGIVPGLHVSQDAMRAVVRRDVGLLLVVQSADLVLPSLAVITLYPSLIRVTLIFLALELRSRDPLAVERDDCLIALHSVEALHTKVIPVRPICVVLHATLNARSCSRSAACCTLVAVESLRVEMEFRASTERAVIWITRCLREPLNIALVMRAVKSFEEACKLASEGVHLSANLVVESSVVPHEPHILRELLVSAVWPPHGAFVQAPADRA